VYLDRVLLYFFAYFRQTMAVFFWERAEDPVSSALVASWMFGSMASHMAHYESDFINSFEKNKQ